MKICLEFHLKNQDNYEVHGKNSQFQILAKPKKCIGSQILLITLKL